MSLLRTSTLLVTAGSLVILAGTRSVAPPSPATAARGCPPGFVSAERLAAETRASGGQRLNGLRARTVENETPASGCRRRSAPEPAGELLTVQADPAAARAAARRRSRREPTPRACQGGRRAAGSVGDRGSPRARRR